MRYCSNPMRIWGTILVVIASFATSAIGQVKRQPPPAPTMGAADAPPAAQLVPPCASVVLSSPAGHPPVVPKAHSVTLSWKASIPRSNSRQDAIQGYYVYRSLVSNHYADSNKLNAKPLPTTQCVDTAVTSGMTYFYVVKAVAKSGLSGPSNEAKVPIPSP